MATTLSITDTGKYYVGGSVPSGEQQAYGTNGSAGTALTLHVEDASFTEEAMHNETPIPNKKEDNTDTKRFKPDDIDKMGIMNALWTFKGFFRTRTPDGTADTTNLYAYGRLRAMNRTKGYKTINVSATTTMELVSYSRYGMREIDAEGTKTVSNINVRIKSLTFKHSTKEHGIFWTMVCKELD